MIEMEVNDGMEYVPLSEKAIEHYKETYKFLEATVQKAADAADMSFEDMYTFLDKEAIEEGHISLFIKTAMERC